MQQIRFHKPFLLASSVLAIFCGDFCSVRGPLHKLTCRSRSENEPDTFFVPVPKKGLAIDPHVSNPRSRVSVLQGVQVHPSNNFVQVLVLVCYTTTQLAIQLHQERIQVVRSNREAQKRPTESNCTPTIDLEFEDLRIRRYHGIDLTCKRGSVGQSEGVLIPMSLVSFRLKPENSNSHGFELYRPSIKVTKLLFKVIKAIIVIK